MFHHRNIVGSTALTSPVILRAKTPILRAKTRDAMQTYDAATRDSTGAFLVGELERLDQTVNEPLVAYTWSRDIDLREDVSIADEVASYTNSSFAATGGVNPNGKAWVGKTSNAIPTVMLDIGKTPQPLHLWAMELSWTIPELESAIKIGRPIDAQKLDGLNLKLQMDIDEQVYIGDTTLPSCFGLTNNALVTPTNAPNGASGASTFVSKTPAEILKDFNTLITQAWAATGFAVAPTDIRLPPVQFGYLASQVVSTAGNMSLLKWLQENCLSNTVNGRPVNIQPLKWLTGRGVGATDRMIAYTKDPKYVRFPLVPLQRTPVEYRSLYQITTYFGRLGQVEARYPETLAYMDGI